MNDTPVPPMSRSTENSGLRITFVTETYVPEVNGVARTLQRIIAALSARGHRVSLVRPRQGRERVERDEGVERTVLVMPIPLPWYKGIQGGVPAFRKLAAMWKHERPDLLYVATEGPLGLAAVLVARYLGIPVISGFHTNFPSYCKHYRVGFLKSPIFRYLRYFHNRTAMTLAPTRELQMELERERFDRTAVLGRGVDLELFAPDKRSRELRARWGVADGQPVALYVGRIAAEKNIHLAIDAYDAMKELNPELRFVLVGDGPVAAELAQGRQDLIFAGVHTGESLAAHYASADLFLFPSKTETFGNVVLEAMASGLAVVSYDYAAGREVGRDGINGHFARLGDRSHFIERSLALMADPGVVARLGREARATALSCSWESVYNQFESYLLETLRGDDFAGDQEPGVTSTLD